MSERVQIGDVFEDLDPRSGRTVTTKDGFSILPRRVKVIGPGKVPGWGVESRWVVVDLDTGRHARIEEDRLLRGGARGYRKVEPEPCKHRFTQPGSWPGKPSRCLICKQIVNRPRVEEAAHA